MKNILLDLRIFNNFETGIGRYAHLVKKLIALQTDNRYFLLFNREYRGKEEYHGNHTAILSTDIPVFGIQGLYRINRIIKENNIDLYNSFFMFLPFLKYCKQVPVIHDIISLRFKKSARFHVRVHDHLMLKHCIRNADRIIVDSAFTGNDIRNYCHIEGENIDVIPAAITKTFAPVQDQRLLNRLKTNYHLDSPFILYAGSRKPNKNICRIIEAMDIIKKENCLTVKLVIAGKPDKRYREPETLTVKRNLENDIIFLHNVPDTELAALYSMAEIFIWPSYYEGFGIPILEAMACGTPVITSGVTSHPEIGGDAVCYFNPDNAREIVNHIYTIIKNRTVRDTMIMRGYGQCKKYSWKKSAELLAQVHQRA